MKVRNLSSDDLQEIEAILREERRVLRLSLQDIDLHNEETEALSGELTDAAASDVVRLHNELVAIGTALDRIAGRSYGTCAVCGRPIESSRLERHPSTIRCERC